MANIDIGKVAITAKGFWQINDSYEKLTLVVYKQDGNGYISLVDNIGVVPGTNESVWQLASLAGSSIYDLCVNNGSFTGTKEEFIEDYNNALNAAKDAAKNAKIDTDAAIAEFNKNSKIALVIANQKIQEVIDNANKTVEGYATQEAERVAAEEFRKTSETSRVIAESTRNSNENERISNENIRKENEESRKTAENSRVSAETTRENNTTQALSDINTAINVSDEQTLAAKNATSAATSASVNANEAAKKANDAADQLPTVIPWDHTEPIPEFKTVRYDTQNLTNAEKEQARKNIGVASGSQVNVSENNPNSDDAEVWVDLSLDPEGSVVVPEAPSNGIPYYRKDKGWYQAVGATTPEGGEIFNSYGNNNAGINTHTEGVANNIPSAGSHGEGARNITKKETSYVHIEGADNICSANICHVEGYKTEAINNYEHSQGIGNKSNIGTIDSVGIGNGGSIRKNATETMSNGKHYIYGVGGYDGTNSVEENADGVLAQDVASVINSGESSFRKLWINFAKNATYSDSEGYKLNGISLTYEEAQFHYGVGVLNFGIGAFEQINIKTNPVSKTNGLRGNYWYENRFDCKYIFAYCPQIEKIVFNGMNPDYNIGLRPSDCASMFINCRKLKYIDEICMNLSPRTDNMFRECISLEEVHIFSLKTSISFSDSPRLSQESIKFMVDNAIKTEQGFTITFNKALEDKIPYDVLRTARNKNITLAFA